MKEMLIVVLSAIVGYVVLSAFSTTNSPKEAMRRIIEQPHISPEQQKELDLARLTKEKEQKLAELQNQKEIEALKAQQNIAISKEKFQTDVRLKEIDYQKDSKLAELRYSSYEKQKEQDNKMLIGISILLFILIFIYLRYQKNLAQMEIEKEKEYKDLLAKKEYAEKILSIVASGNISIETEKKLLKILDDINNPKVNSNNRMITQHQNPDIDQLPFQR
jgi:uncharacterized membrane protein YqiK